MKHFAWQSLFVSFVFLVISSQAATITHVGTTTLETARPLWRPTQLVNFGGDAVCFAAADGTCSLTVCSETILCSFDDGKTWSTPDLSLPYCGSRGVLVDGQLHCAHEQLPSSAEGHLEYAVATFTVIDGSLTAALSTDKQMTFNVTKESKIGSITTLQHVGSPLFLEEEAIYIMPTVAFDGNGTKVPIVFSSPDGFAWTTVSKLPFKHDVIEMSSVQMGKKRIGVISRTAEGYERVTSGYLGKWWSEVKHLNSTAPPFSFIYPSGLTLEYGTSNVTQSAVSYFAEEIPKLGRKVFHVAGGQLFSAPKKSSRKEAKETSSHAVAFQSSLERLVTIHDGIDKQGKKSLQMSIFSVNDTEERVFAKEKLEKEAKKQAEQVAAREKAKRERIERQGKERRERRLKEAQRREAFAVLDRPNIALASKLKDLDGELIVVRKTRKEYVDLEKQTFFW